MKCTDVRASLPLLMYGGTTPPEEAALNDHLAHCPACRREQQELESIRHLLDTVPVPHVEVDLPRLYRTWAARQAGSPRRWRRIALALGAVAALLLFALSLRLEVRWVPGQMVVRWGQPPAPAPVPPQPLVTHYPLPPETEAELRVLRELIHALKQDADDREQRCAERIEHLQGQLRAIQSQADRRWNATEHDVAALYLLTHKGEKP